MKKNLLISIFFVIILLSSNYVVYATTSNYYTAMLEQKMEYMKAELKYYLEHDDFEELDMNYNLENYTEEQSELLMDRLYYYIHEEADAGNPEAIEKNKKLIDSKIMEMEAELQSYIDNLLSDGR